MNERRRLKMDVRKLRAEKFQLEKQIMALKTTLLVGQFELEKQLQLAKAILQASELKVTEGANVPLVVESK